MLGKLIVVLLLVITLIGALLAYAAYHAAASCTEGKGGLLCKIWSWVS